MYTSEIVCQLSAKGSFPCAPLVWGWVLAIDASLSWETMGNLTCTFFIIRPVNAYFFFFFPNNVPLNCYSAVCRVREIPWQALTFWWFVGVDKEELTAAGTIIEEHGRNPVNAEPVQSLKADVSRWGEVMTGILKMFPLPMRELFTRLRFD